MKKLNLMKLASLVIALLATSSLFAQGLKDVRFNEVLVKNTNNILNPEGERVGWIEITNIGFTTIDLGGCYLEKITPNGKSTHTIPKGLKSTVLAPQNYIVIFTGSANQGPLSAIFNLEDATGINLYDASGKLVLDRINLNPNSAKSDVSMVRPLVDRSTLSGRTLDIDKDTRSTNLVESLTLTPNESNEPIALKSRAEAFLIRDPSGVGMAVVAMSVVFLALLSLFLIFQQVGNAMQRMGRRDQAKLDADKAKTTPSSAPVKATPDFNSEILVAIAFAIDRYNRDMEEAHVLTINRTAKAYSPWSSKIHGLTQLPNRK